MHGPIPDDRTLSRRRGRRGGDDFYKRAFGAEERLRVPGPDRTVMHAEILINGGLVMLTDSAPHVGFPAPAPGEKVPVGIIMMVAWPKPEDVDAIHARARRGVQHRAARRTVGGARFAAMTDPYGQRWWLHALLAGQPLRRRPGHHRATPGAQLSSD